MTVQEQLAADIKTAMRERDKHRLGVLRMAQSELKQQRIDAGELDDATAVASVEKMVKKRRDAETQYRDAGRHELADAEAAEADILKGYLPAQLDASELDAEIDRAIGECGAQSMKDMGNVMAVLKPRVQGRADMSNVSSRVKGRLVG